MGATSRLTLIGLAAFAVGCYPARDLDADMAMSPQARPSPGYRTGSASGDRSAPRRTPNYGYQPGGRVSGSNAYQSQRTPEQRAMPRSSPGRSTTPGSFNAPLPDLVPARPGSPMYRSTPSAPAPRQDGGCGSCPGGQAVPVEPATREPAQKPVDASDDDRHPSRWKKKLKAHYA